MTGSSLCEKFSGAGRVVVAKSRKRPKPFSIRFTAEERTRLNRAAGKLSLSAYIRMKVLGDDIAPRNPRHMRKQRTPSMDHEVIAKLLGLLGQSELGPSLIAIAYAAQMGALPVDDELTAKLHNACDDISDMRSRAVYFQTESERDSHLRGTVIHCDLFTGGDCHAPSLFP